MQTLRRARRPLIALLALVAALVVGYGVRAWDDGGSSGPVSAQPTVSSVTGAPLSQLPAEAAATVRLIENGGPFPYTDHDGVVFHNFEHRLPSEPDGYYHEYTVPTPGSPDRGARRIITGSDGQFWYTADHYETFDRVDVRR